MTTEKKPPPDHEWRFRKVDTTTLIERFESQDDPNEKFKHEDKEIEYQDAPRGEGGGQYNLFSDKDD